MATHSSILAWKIPWTTESGGLQSMRLQRVGHEFSTVGRIGSPNSHIVQGFTVFYPI